MSHRCLLLRRNKLADRYRFQPLMHKETASARGAAEAVLGVMLRGHNSLLPSPAKVPYSTAGIGG
jgi:hypothetical protein